MDISSLDDIRAKARQFAAKGKLWHFHLLTADCLLNTHKLFALILENGSDHESFTYLSQEKPMEVGKELLELLHGKDVLQKENEELGKLSKNVTHMMQRAKELNDKGFFWHHHVLFPYCMYNKHQGKWTVLLEDPEKKEVLESITDTEPKRDLKEIEPAFYQQHVNS